MCGSRTFLYIHRATLGLIPEVLTMAPLHDHTEQYNFFLLSVRCCFQFSLGSRKTPKYYTERRKAISFPPSLKVSYGSDLYFVVKTTTSVFSGSTVRPLVSYHLCIIFRALVRRSLRVLSKFSPNSMAMSSA